MGLWKKIKQYALPVIGALLGAGVGGLAFFGMNAIEGYMLGSALANIGNKRKLGSGADQSPTYGFGPPRNTLSNMLPVPIVYGKMKCHGNLVWSRSKTGNLQDRAVVLCQGEVEEVGDVRINNRPVGDYSGCSASVYVGTPDQLNDSRMTDYKGSMKKLAYVAATVKASEQLRGDPVMSAVVKGRKVKVWNGLSWSTVWNENPAWIVRDFLLNECGIDESVLDTDSFYDVAQYADETIIGDYDRDRNIALAYEGAICSGGTNPGYGNDGSLTTANSGWYVAASQSESMTYLGKLDLGQSYYTNFLKLHLWDGDGRQYYNFKITGSDNDVDYDTLFDGTGSGINYSGVQHINFTAANYRYFKVYGSANNIDTGFHVKEIEVFNLMESKRFKMGCIIDTNRTARDALEDMLATFGGYLVLSKGVLKLKCDRAEASVAADFDVDNIVRDSVNFRQLARREKPNRAVVYFTNPFNGWLRDDASDDDSIDQAENGIQQKEISLLYITRPAQARRMARQAANIARLVDWIASWQGGLNAVQCEPGDIVTLTSSLMGWTDKKFKIIDIKELPSGKRKIIAREHIASIYDDQSGGYFESGDVTSLPDPVIEPPKHVTGLAISEDKDQHKDGSWLPKINVSWTNPDDPFFHVADVEMSVTDESNYRVVGSAPGTSFQIKNLAAGETYYVRVVSVNQFGVKAPSGTAPKGSITLAGKDVAPSDVTGFNYDLGRGYIQLRWNTAWDANNDLSYYEVRDGASWAAGTVLFTDCKTTKKQFRPDKRTYHLWIKAFDRSGNESAAAAELSISKPAPQASTPTLYQQPPSGLLVEFPTIGSTQIYRYDVHISTLSGFTPGATTLKAQAAPGTTGKAVAVIDGVADTTYYVKICAIDFYSDYVGDGYDYPSGQASKTIRKIEGGDIYANQIVTNHLSTSGLDIGGGTDKAPYFRLINNLAQVVGYVGEFVWNSTNYWGGRFKNLIVGDETDPAMVVTDDGTARISRGLKIGPIGTSDKILSNEDPATNLLYNGGFEMVKKVGTWSTDNDKFAPGWILEKNPADSDAVKIISRAESSDSLFAEGYYACNMWSDENTNGYIRSDKIRIPGSTKFQFSMYVRVDGGASVPLKVRIRYRDSSETWISDVWLIDQTITNTTMSRITSSDTSPTNARFCEIFIYTPSNPGYLTWLYFDSVKLEKGNEVTAYTETPINSAHHLLGFNFDPEKGSEIYSSGNLINRIGNIGGLSDGKGGTIAADTMGTWQKGSNYLLNDAGNLMISFNGIEDTAYVSDTIAKSILTTALQAIVQSSGNTDSNRPHDWHLAFVASGTTTLTDSFPVSIAHGQANTPAVVAFVRGYDSSTATYSRWHPIPILIFGMSGDYVQSRSNYFSTSNNTNIIFDAWAAVWTGSADYGYRFSSSSKTNFYLFNSSGTTENIWDQLQFKYFILREGV